MMQPAIEAKALYLDLAQHRQGNAAAIITDSSR